ncbi:MAG: MoaD/ThiS family protein [Deltaproteobacteria bacterium]|jgi:sulfur carrier protein ThiS|nr:MAG: MoaD/ThiS family protein [Deltaproteobacteria bacterium]
MFKEKVLFYMIYSAYFRLYEELNDYLPAERRKTTFTLSLRDPTTIKEAICLLGVPPEEVDLVLVNGESVPFNHTISEGDRISIYPIFESLDISKVTRLRDKPLIKLVKDSKNLNLEGR